MCVRVPCLSKRADCLLCVRVLGLGVAVRRRKNVRAIFNLQEEREHPSCGDGIHAESGFSYFPEEFQNAGGLVSLSLSLSLSSTPCGFVCVLTARAHTHFSVVLQHVVEGHDVAGLYDSHPHHAPDGLPPGSGAQGVVSCCPLLPPICTHSSCGWLLLHAADLCALSRRPGSHGAHLCLLSGLP